MVVDWVLGDRAYCMVIVPFKIAAFPDLIARDAIFAMTSGRASKMMRSTPMGQLTRSSTRPSSSSVRRSILPTKDQHESSVLLHIHL